MKKHIISSRELERARTAKEIMGTAKVFISLGMLTLILAPAAQAANLDINDAVEGQITLTHDANWEEGVNSNGMPFPPGAGGSTVASGEKANFMGNWLVNTGGSPDPGVGIIYFVDRRVLPLPLRRRVSDRITVNWSTVVQGGFDSATITVQVQSSACGKDLGALPNKFTGRGVTDPVGSIGIEGLFRDPTTAAPVTIPSNLTIQFVGKDDRRCGRRAAHNDNDDG